MRTIVKPDGRRNGGRRYCTPCVLYGPDKELIGTYETVREAARAMGCTETFASRLLRGRAVHPHGWRLHHRDSDPKRTARRRPCLGYCGRDRISEGPWDRICGPCKAAQGELGPTAGARHRYTGVVLH